jgi:hypothetical protein
VSLTFLLMIEFCPVCGKILQIKSENGIHIGFCNCGFRRMSGISVESTDNMKNKKDFTKRGEGIAESNEDLDGIDHICKKCGFDKA